MRDEGSGGGDEGGGGPSQASGGPGAGLWRSAVTPRPENAKVRVARLAGRQFGRITRQQMLALGVSEPQITRWLNNAYLHRIHPRVYAVGHRAPSVEADLMAALLYAGPNAMLSHGTAAWWLGLIERPPSRINVSTPHRRHSIRGVRTHQRRRLPSTQHNGLPATTLCQTLLDFAAVAATRSVRHALAKADYEYDLNPDELRTVLRSGRRGSATLRRALDSHQPRLARSRSKLEQTFLALCETAKIPLPQINVVVAGWTVDAFWPGHGLVVELDGHRNHRSPAQIDRDRRKELAVREAGLRMNRYSRAQIEKTGAVIIADLGRSLSSTASSA